MALPTSLLNKSATFNTTSTSNGTIMTHSSALKNPDGTAGNGGILNRAFFYNADSTGHDISFFKVPAGGSVASSALIDRITIPPRGTYMYPGPKYGSSGDFYAILVQEPATSSGGVWVTIDYNEMA
jgi:hypothetical protein